MLRKPDEIPRETHLTALRNLLLAKRAELRSHLGNTRFDAISQSGRVAEEDCAQLSHEEYITLRRNSLEYEELRLVDAALDRCESGEYGTCLHCESPISLRRLQVIPWAQYCVDCQERLASTKRIEEDEAVLTFS